MTSNQSDENDAIKHCMADAVLIPGTPIFGCPTCRDPWESEPSCEHYGWTEQTGQQAHDCEVTGCDGTRLGHDLATDFPEETARFDAAMDRLRRSLRCDDCQRWAARLNDVSCNPPEGGIECSVCNRCAEARGLVIPPGVSRG